MRSRSSQSRHHPVMAFFDQRARVIGIAAVVAVAGCLGCATTGTLNNAEAVQGQDHPSPIDEEVVAIIDALDRLTACRQWVGKDCESEWPVSPRTDVPDHGLVMEVVSTQRSGLCSENGRFANVKLVARLTDRLKDGLSRRTDDTSGVLLVARRSEGAVRVVSVTESSDVPIENRWYETCRPGESRQSCRARLASRALAEVKGVHQVTSRQREPVSERGDSKTSEVLRDIGEGALKVAAVTIVMGFWIGLQWLDYKY